MAHHDVKFRTMQTVIPLVTMNQYFSFLTPPLEKNKKQKQKQKHSESRLFCYKLTNRAPSDHSTNQPVIWAPRPKSRNSLSRFVDDKPATENLHTILSMGY